MHPIGPLQRLEARLAWRLLLPTLTIVFLVVALPLLAIFWISFKPVSLADLRPLEPSLYERFRGELIAVGDQGEIEYRLRNPSTKEPLLNVSFDDELPAGISVEVSDPRCQLNQRQLSCDLGDWPAKFNERLKFPVTALVANLGKLDLRATAPVIQSVSSSNLTNLNFTLDNFTKVFSGHEFVDVLYATAFYTLFGTLGAILVGLFAALLLNHSFRGRGLFRGMMLFPYVAPVIAVAFTWVTLFDPFSGSANALLLQMKMIDSPLNFFGDRALALPMVTVFEVWRYFPLSFLFILARMQSIDTDMYEAAEMDGATPFQKFWYLSIPQLAGILSILFLLRFIWTFNKFDDIFLLTGGNAGTRTLTVDVYEQAFAVSNIGAGAAVAVMVFACLLIFVGLFVRFFSREEGL